jgi:anti-sigma-K factor RskA
MSACGKARPRALSRWPRPALLALPPVIAPRPPPPPVVAPATPVPAAAEVVVINDPTTKRPALVATLDHATDKLILTPVSMKMPAQRDAELWIIPDGQKPISLGVIPQDASARIAVPAGLRGAATYTATLAITDEPLGGSPSGAPTGSPFARRASSWPRRNSRPLTLAGLK